MAKLTTKARNKLPAKDFAGPNRSFPIENKAHAVQAERMLPRAVKAGSVSGKLAGKIKQAAQKVAGNKSGEFDHEGIPHHESMRPFVGKAGSKC